MVVARDQVCQKEQVFNPDLIISISEPNQLPPSFKTKQVLLLNFKDICFDSKLDPSPLAPKEEHILQIIEFASKAKNKKILIHCHAGISRSSAAAIILAREVCGDDQEALRQISSLNVEISPEVFETGNTWFMPNNLMISLYDKIKGTNMSDLLDTFFSY